eukprot:4039581-Amphidinium_carterae.1
MALESKAVTAYTVDTSAAFVRRMSYMAAEILTDGEPAVIALAEAIKSKVAKYGIRLTVINAPRYSPQTLGSVGKMQDLLGRQMRVLRACFQKRYNRELTPDSVLWPWLIRHAAWCVERLHVKGNQRTAYEECYGHQWNGVVVPFAEVCMF